MCLISWILIFASLNILITGQIRNKRLLCSEVDEYDRFTMSTRRLQGPPGKMGPPGNNGIPGAKGDRGYKGFSGQPGTVDYHRLRGIVEGEVIEENRQLKSEVSILRQEMRTMKSKQMKSEQMMNCLLHGVKVGSKCFIIDVHSTEDTTLAQAEQFCTSKGAKLADIYNKQEYDAIMESLRSKIPEGDSSFVAWTGVKRDLDGNAVLSTGSISPFKKVRSSVDKWIEAEARRTHAYLIVRSDVDHSDQGFGAIWPTYEAEGTICVFSLPENQQQKSQIDVLNQEYKNLKHNYTKLEGITSCLFHGVKVGTKCFIVEAHVSRDTILTEADRICENKGARLADISSADQYNAIVTNFRNKIPDDNDALYIWTAMKRDQDGNAVLSNGQISPYKKVRSRTDQWVEAEASQTHIYLLVREDMSDEGFGSISPSHDTYGALCLFE